MINGNKYKMFEKAKSNVYYQEIKNECFLFQHAFESKLPLMIKGPTGCGKTRFVEYMANELNRPLITVSCNEDTTVSDLLGRHLFIGGETKWADGPVTRAVRQGAILYLDEFVEARSDTLVAIHSLSDHRRTMYLDRTSETIKAPDTFMLIVSFNPGYQRTLKELKPSTRQRFVSLSFDYPDDNVEAEIISHESQVEMAISKKLVKIAKKIRGLKEMNLLEVPSTRLLIAAGTLISRGVQPREACQASISEILTDDADVMNALNHLISLNF